MNITLKDYCPKARHLTAQDMILFHVNQEAETMYPAEEFKPIKFEAPDYQKPYKCAGWQNFYKKIMP